MNSPNFCISTGYPLPGTFIFEHSEKEAADDIEGWEREERLTAAQFSHSTEGVDQ